MGGDQLRSKSETAWATAARCAALAYEADDAQEREHYTRMRDAWITLANRCELLDVPDVTDSEKLSTPEPSHALGKKRTHWRLNTARVG
jgi:hypothetical protein